MTVALLKLRRRAVVDYSTSRGKKYVYDLIADFQEGQKTIDECTVLLRGATRGECRKLAAQQLSEGGQLRELWISGSTYRLGQNGKWLG